MNDNDQKSTEIEAMLDGLDKDALFALYHNVRDRLEASICTQMKRNSFHEIQSVGGAHSMASVIEMLPHIWEELKREPRRSTFSWLDVGPGAGYGAGLLADLYSGIGLGYNLEVTTADIRGNFTDLIALESPNIKEHLVGDIFSMQREFDFVSASHVIEHVPQPEDFVRRLQQIARKRVFILTPWKEREDKLTKGHCNIFDESFIEKLGNPEYETLHSVAWGAFLDPPYEVLFLNLPGLAGEAASAGTDGSPQA